MTSTQPHRDVHLPGLDALRLGGFIAIIGIHALSPARYHPLAQAALAAPLWSWLWFSVPALFLVAGCLHASAGERNAKWLATRLQQLLAPYMLASLAYRGFALGKASLGWTVATSAAPAGLGTQLLTGTAAGHLWFLLVLAECTLLVWLADRVRGGLTLLLATSIPGAAWFLSLQLAETTSAETLHLAYRSPLWWLPFYALGALAWRRRELLAEPNPLVLLGVGTILSVGRVYFGEAPLTVAASWLGAGMVGLGGLGVALAWPLRLPRPLAQASRATLLPYLVHYAVLDVLFVLAGKLGWEWSQYLGLVAWAGAALLSFAPVAFAMVRNERRQARGGRLCSG